MNKRFLQLGAFFGCSAVILGAFSAHLLESKLNVSQNSAFDTAVQYQFYHTFAILIIAILSSHFKSKAINWSGRFFVAGIICFSGSLYLLACKNLFAIESWGKILGPITPIGGMFFIIGWSLLFYATLEKRTKV